jgi:Secretion system C-terminal sorting domain/Beta-propeller repeat
MKKITLLLLFTFSTIYSQFNYQREWATYAGIDTRTINQVMDSQGNIIIVGAVYSNNYVTLNAHQANYGGSSDGYMAKYSMDGILQWATFFGGTDNDQIVGVTIDENDDIYICGDTNSITNIATAGSFLPNLPAGGNAGFISKFNSNGVQQWGTYYYSNTVIFGVSLYNNTLIIYGNTSNASDIATPNAFQTTMNNAFYNGFITKFDRTGNKGWSTYYSSPFGLSIISASAINSSGIYLSGMTTETSGFFATTGCHQLQNNGGSDNYLTKFDFNGNRVWSTYYGGNSYEGNSIVSVFNMTCNEDAVYLTDSTYSSTDIATPNTFQSNFTNPSRYLVKFNNDGIRQWGTYFASGISIHGYDGIFTINLDSSGNCLVSGSTNKKGSSTTGSYQAEIAGLSNSIYPEIAEHTDILVTKFNPSGQRLWATYYGGEQNESLNESVFNSVVAYNDIFYICGVTQSTTDIATLGSQQPNYDAGNAFIAKFSPIPLNTTSNSLENTTLFPNPNTGNFTLQGNYTGDLAIIIYDNQGRTVFSQETISFQGKDTVAVASNLSSGIYFVKVFNDNLAKTYKMIVR